MRGLVRTLECANCHRPLKFTFVRIKEKDRYVYFCGERCMGDYLVDNADVEYFNLKGRGYERDEF